MHNDGGYIYADNHPSPGLILLIRTFNKMNVFCTILNILVRSRQPSINREIRVVFKGGYKGSIAPPPDVCE